jgi:hypothetical protein
LRGASIFTRAQAALLDAHFGIEQRGRALARRFFPFNGTAGLWRREAIERAAGWSSSTLTEDLDLSVRAYRAGCRFAYSDDVVVPAELPQTISAWRVQQHRWAKGGAQTFRRHAWSLLRAGRVDALLRTGQSLAFLPLLALLVLLPFVRLDGGAWWLAFGWLPFVSCVVAGTPRRAGDWIAALALGVATAPIAAVGVVEGLIGAGSSVFARTPKRGGRARGRAMLALVEVALGAAHVSAAVLRGDASSVALCVCGAGLLAVGVGDVCEALIARRQAPARARTARKVSRAPPQARSSSSAPATSVSP